MATSKTLESQGVRVAVEGCGHGTLDAIYASVAKSCEVRGWDGVDLLIIGGDFQSVRNAADLTIMSCPVKYRQLGDFPKYYSGEAKAPYLTIFIGGNHEASSHLWELYYGGWVAPNIYYMGAANVLRLGPIRIAGLSGIWKGFDYSKPHHERLPFNADDVKSFYHVREFDARKLLLIRSQVDVGLSHDWPRAIEYHGDSRALFKKKPFFKQESEDGTLGSVAAKLVMDRLRPPYWFSAHMHVKFAALRKYEAVEEKQQAVILATASSGSEKTLDGKTAPEANPDEIDLDMEDEAAGEGNSSVHPEKPENATETSNDVSEELRAELPASFARPEPKSSTNSGRKATPGQPVPSTIPNKEVRFLALDKCLPGRHFLQVCEIHPHDAASASQPTENLTAPRYSLSYDPEWLAITRVFHPMLKVGSMVTSTERLPDHVEEHYLPLIDKEKEWVEENIVKAGRLQVPENFELTAPPHVPGTPEIVDEQPDEYTNPQTARFCELLDIPNIWDASEEERAARKAQGPKPSEQRSRGNERGGHRNDRRGGGRGGRGGRGGGGGRGRGRGRGRW